MENELLLISGQDIPFLEAQINIHQPRIFEIALIGEESFLLGCQLLVFSKEKIPLKDRNGLENKSDFEILMSIMCNSKEKEYVNNVLMLLSLLFPQYKIKITLNEILLAGEQNITRINNENFNIFKNIVDSIFSLHELELANGDFNPASERASRIAEKIKKGREKVAQLKGKNPEKKVAVFSRYISILSVGLHKDMNSYMNYTVFQLQDEFKRYQMKQSFDQYIQFKIAGAQDLEDVDNWMDDIHTSLI